MKKIIALSAVAALATTSFASGDVESRLSAMEAKVKKLEKKLKKANKKLNDVKAHDANDNIKWNIDFRTAIDSIEYKMADGTKYENSDLLTNRLWLGMAYAPSDNVFFKGKLSYNKAYGDTANHSQSNSAMGAGFSNFDWVTNENATDNTLKVKEAYWLYMNDTFMGTEVPWTISFGRRPSTDGLGINMREGMKDNSPLSHTVNVEFDGASAKFNLDKVTGIEGMWWKLCTGRGLTNAMPRFNMDVNGADYAKDSTKNPDVDMYGFIFVPWDNGQYSIRTNFAKAVNMIGFEEADMMNFQFASMGYDPTSVQKIGGKPTPTKYLNGSATSDGVNAVDAGTYYYDAAGVPQAVAGTDKTFTDNNSLIAGAKMGYAPSFKSFGDMTLFTAMFRADGIGEEISDFLDNTKFFASFAQSKTDPAANSAMLGSTDSQTGHSWWVGANMPCPLTDDGRIGIEWNKGSKYWRSVTYGEDTMAGSKIAARGTAVEAYYIKPLTKSLTLNARYTQIEYDYTGSQMFFGEDGTPRTMAEAKAMGQNPVEEATDLRVSVSYKF